MGEGHKKGYSVLSALLVSENCWSYSLTKVFKLYELFHILWHYSHYCDLLGFFVIDQYKVVYKKAWTSYILSYNYYCKPFELHIQKSEFVLIL